MSQFIAKPSPDRYVRSPDHGGQLLPPEGLPVSWSVYWQARLDEGDITREEIAPDPAPATARPAKPPKSED